MSAKKAIVLAAGLGTRLRPLTSAVPKPLLPVWGESMISRIVALLRKWGAKEIAANCHYLSRQTEDWCRENGVYASVEKEIMGTGGALDALRDWIGADDFFLVNADIILEGVDECPFTLFTRPSSGVYGASLIGECLATEEGPRTIEVSPEGDLVTCWKSPDPGYPGTWTYAGAALLKNEILRYVPRGEFSTIVQAYEKASMDGLFMRALSPKGLVWADAGSIDTYISLNSDGEDNDFRSMPQLKAASEASSEFADGEVRFLGARGSERCFFATGKAVAVLYDDANRGENAKYASHAKWLKGKGAPVPEIFADLPELKTLVMENAGTEKKMSLAEYVRVAESLASFGMLDASSLDLEPAFGPALWKWETDLFAKYSLEGRYGISMPPAAAEEYRKIAQLLEGEPKGLVHRDFQRTNILWNGEEFKFIDFQGMRLGPVVYDLASLLYDPYATLCENDRSALAKVYARKCGRDGIVKILPYAAVQRLSQCLGAYGRLESVGQPQFAKYIMPALEGLLAAADEAGLDAIGALAEDLIAKETALGKDSCHCGEDMHAHKEGCSCHGGHRR